MPVVYLTNRNEIGGLGMRPRIDSPADYSNAKLGNMKRGIWLELVTQYLTARRSRRTGNVYPH